MESIRLSESQKIQIETQLRMIQGAHAKVQAHQFTASELEKDFQKEIAIIIKDNGGNPNDEYNYDLENGVLTLIKQLTDSDGWDL